MNNNIEEGIQEGITKEDKEEIPEEIEGTEEEETQRNTRKKYKGAILRNDKTCGSKIRLSKDKELWLGSYRRMEEAARAFDAASICLRGVKALPNLNFPLALTSSSDGLNTGRMSNDSITKIAHLAAHSGNLSSCSSTYDPDTTSCLPPSRSIANSVEEIDALATQSGTTSLPSSTNNVATTLLSCMPPFHSPSTSMENLEEQESGNVVWDEQDFGENGDIKLWNP